MTGRTFAEVLQFWFGWPDAPDYGQYRKPWFVKDASFDALIRERFLATWESAASGQLDAWVAVPRSALALVVVLDQFPRNLFRGEARAFSTDASALKVVQAIVDAGQDRAFLPVERGFVYLPFEHAEDLAMQQRSLQLFAGLAHEPAGRDMADYARRHHDVIARFGRFPHRNAMLGRPSTADELAYLAEPGSGF